MRQEQLPFEDHERQERVRRYLNSTGFWFASCPNYEEDAKRACAAGLLQPADNLLPPSRRNRNSRAFFVRAQLRSVHELPVGLYRHLVEGMPC